MAIEELDWSKLWDNLASVFRLQLDDEDQKLMQDFWEGLMRSSDDALIQLQQYNSSKSVNFAPTLILKTWLNFDINWDPTDAVHAHSKNEFFMSPGQTEIQLDFRAEDIDTTIYVQGAEQSFDGVPIELDNTGTETIVRFGQPFLGGEVIIIHTLKKKLKVEFQGDGITSVILFGGASDKDTVEIKMNNISLISGILVGSQSVTFRGGLKNGDVVRILRGDQLHSIVATEGLTQVDTPFPLDVVDTKVFINGLSPSEMSIEDDRVVFFNAPRVGDKIEIIATLIDEHNHQILDFVYPSDGAQSLTLPVPPRTENNVETADSPVLLFVGGYLQPKSRYALQGSQILLPAAPEGTRAVIQWTTLEQSGHRHDLGDVTSTEIGTNFVFEDEIQAPLVTVDGLALSEGIDYIITGELNQIVVFNQQMPENTRVKVQSKTPAFTFVAATGFPSEVRSADCIQDGIDLPETVLLSGEGFDIIDGQLFSQARLEPVWFKNALVDEQTIQNNFAPFTIFDQVESSEEFTLLVRAMIAAFVLGPRTSVVENFARVIFGLPFVDGHGVVLNVVTDKLQNITTVTVEFSNPGIVDIELPRGIRASVKPGDIVTPLQSLATGVTLLDSSSNWLERFPWLLYALEERSPTFQPASHIGRGVQVTSDRTMTYNTPVTRLDMVGPLDLPEGLRKGDRVSFWDGVTTFVNIVASVSEDRRTAFLTDHSLLTVPGNGTAVTVTFTYRVRPGLDAGWFLDQADQGYIDEMNQRLFDLFKTFLFAVEVDAALLKDSAAMQNLIEFLDSVKAAETDYILFARLGSSGFGGGTGSGPLGDGDGLLSGGEDDAGILDDAAILVTELEAPVLPGVGGVGFTPSVGYLYAGFGFSDFAYVGPAP